jgi:hypothetical protein
MTCKKCRSKNLPAVMSKASECGHDTNRGCRKWCGKCALARGVCMTCGQRVDGKKTRPSRRRK